MVKFMLYPHVVIIVNRKQGRKNFPRRYKRFSISVKGRERKKITHCCRNSHMAGNIQYK